MSRFDALSTFVTWYRQHITGDEKGEAQIFLDRLFQAFGLGGIKEAGATLEMRVAKRDRGGTSFADLVWKPVVLLEMKRRGENLQKHYRQAFDYWVPLVPGRPHYVVLCNFDEFWVYDFETDLDTPKDKLATVDLPDRWGALAFLAREKPTFGLDRVAVTREAADKLALLFNRLVARGVDRESAQRFVLQMLVALFAEDIGLLDKYFLSRLLDDCVTPADTYDLIGGLFEAMNTHPPKTGGRFKGVDYFDGGLFAVPARLELQMSELELLREATTFDWSKVQPEIFGTLFQHSLGGDDRRTFGAHFTHPADIMKIVSPTIVYPWRQQIEGAKTLARLLELRDRLHRFRVLDPACGSGNFLYIAYRELKRLEARLYERVADFPSRPGTEQVRLSFLGAQNFYGIDVLPFAVEIAKVTIVIARKLAIDELHISERALPLANLDRNFLAGDALLTADGGRTLWPEADAIIGNPPFAGAKLLKPERGVGYVKALRRAYPEVPGMADYCVYWLRKAHDHLPPCTQADPVAGHAGLVGTQNIRNNKSRIGGLDHVVEDGTIVEAVDNQPWSGEANVNVSIVNWVKTQAKALLPQKRRLWFKVDPADKQRHIRGKGAAGKEYQLDVRECDFINSALSDQTDVSGAKLLSYPDAVPVVCQGITPGHDGFVLTASERRRLIWIDPGSETVTFPYLIGRELLNGNGTPDHYLIDFGQMSILDAQEAAAAVDHVRETVLPDIQRRADEEDASESAHKDQLDRWWQHWRGRRELIAAVAGLRRYLVCSGVTKRPIFTFVARSVRPGDALQVFALEDDYSFGILQSRTHWLWFTTKCSKLAERFRYTPESVFDTFPWPQAPIMTHVEAVVVAGRELRRVRAGALKKLKGGLRALYRTLDLPGENPLKDAHAALDAAVLQAYGFSAQRDLLTQLLTLNLTVAARLEKGDPVSAPGVPKNYPDAASLVTDDCVEPREGTAPKPIPLASVPIAKYGNTDPKGKPRR